MTLKQEITTILKTESHSIVEERILLPIIDHVALWTEELVKKLVKLEGEDKKTTQRVYNRIHADLVGQTIKQLIEYQCEGRKIKDVETI
mgnify:CR=1 FL=1